MTAQPQSGAEGPTSRGRRLKTVTNAARLLRLLAEADRPMGVSEIARQLKLGKSTVHSILQSLADAGLVGASAEGGRYGLDVGAVELGAAALEHLKLGNYLDPPMERLASASKEAVSFAIRSRRDALIVKRFESSQVLRAEIRVGTRMPLHTSASGKCLLAAMSDEQIHELYPEEKLPEWEGHSIETKTELFEVIERVREQGYAVNIDEFTLGVTAVAVGIQDGEGMINGALSIAGPSARFSWEQWLEPLRETAREMGANPGPRKKEER